MPNAKCWVGGMAGGLEKFSSVWNIPECPPHIIYMDLAEGLTIQKLLSIVRNIPDSPYNTDRSPKGDK